jgi:hypothetical protein
MATVPVTPRTNSFTAPATSAGPYEIGFRLFDSDGIEVYLDGVLTEDYTVSAAFANGYDDDATITFDDAITSGTDVQIDGATLAKREADYVASDPQLAAKLNVELARIAAALNELAMKMGRTVRSLSAIDADPDVTAAAVQDLAGDVAAAAASASAAAASAATASSAAATALANAALLGLWRGPWLTATAYALGDRAQESGSTYICVVPHTSGTFATDLAAVKWQMFAQKGAAGAGTGDVLTENQGSEYDPEAFRANLSLVSSARKFNNGTGLTGFGDLTADRTPELTGQALALHNLGTNGLIARTGSGTVAGRILTGTANQISVSDGDGVSGNPIIAAVVASKAEAEAGTDTTKIMTAERVAQAIAAQGPGAPLLVQTVTGSSVAAIDFDLALAAGYRGVKFLFVNVRPVANGASFWMRVSRDGGATFDAGASDYRVGLDEFSYLPLNVGPGAITNTSTAGLCGEVTLLDHAGTVYRKRIFGQVTWTDSSSQSEALANQTYGVRIGTSDPITDVRFLMSANNIAVDSTIVMYGFT